MNDQKANLAPCIYIGEVRRPCIRQRSNEKDNRMYFYCSLEILGSNWVKDIYIDESTLNRSTGDMRHLDIFDKVKDLKHGSRIIIECVPSVTIKDDKLYINYTYSNVYPFASDIVSAFRKLGVTFD